MTNTITFAQVKDFLTSFNLVPGEDIILTFEQYRKVVSSAKTLFNDEFASFIMDCFMPNGDAIQKGYEDSLSFYIWLPEYWYEIEDEFNSWIEGASQ